MTSAANQTGIYLAAQGLGAIGGTADWAIYIGTEPVDPANCITVYDTGGAAPMLAEIDLRRPSVQVRVRAANYPDGWEKINDAQKALASAGQQTEIDSETIGWFGLGDIFAIGRDEKDNHLFTCNFEMMRSTL